MRAKRKNSAQEEIKLRNYLAQYVQDARARGAESAVLNAGQICAEVAVDYEGGFVVCCRILDSERFAKAHGLWYHHRIGV